MLLSRFFKWLDELLWALIKGDTPMEPIQPTPTPITPPITQNTANPDILASDWSTQHNAYHNVRVLCDLAGLTVNEKNLICACIYQESRFKNTAIGQNKNHQGIVVSTDYGICQVNDYYHIGNGKDFPSVDYVLTNPDIVVRWMISMYKHGMLKQWVSYSSGAYKPWLLSTSPMFKL